MEGLENVGGRRMSILPPVNESDCLTTKTGGMLEIPDANTKERDIVEEQKKRNKAKLDKKLKEQEGLVNSNQAVMVRDRRRPRKSIKEMSVLNKRRRVIKNTARKEIAQQKATLENMRHIELKRYSLEARELDLFVERVRKVKENKRLTMLFSKFESESEESDNDDSTANNHERKDTANQSQGEAEPTDSSTLAERQKTESMTNLLDELNRMSLLIDVDKNPQWKTFIHGDDNQPKMEDKEDVEICKPLQFKTKIRRNQALEAPGVLQSMNTPTFPNLNDRITASKDDSEINESNPTSRFRRCVSQPIGMSVGSNNLSPKRLGNHIKLSVTENNLASEKSPNGEEDDKKTSRQVDIPDRISDVASVKKKSLDMSSSIDVESVRKKAPYHTNWREREKRGDTLYSPVALSPIQKGLMSPDFVMEDDEDNLTTKYTKNLNPKRFKTEIKSSGDMEFNQAINKAPTTEGQNRKASFQGTQTIIEMQLEAKTKSIAERVQKVRKETIRVPKKSRESKENKIGAKNIAEMIHQSGDGNRFIEEVKLLRQFASMCNCKYLRTDPEKLDERRQSYVDALVNNVAKRVQIRNRWKLGLGGLKRFPTAVQHPISLPLIYNGSSK